MNNTAAAHPTHPVAAFAGTVPGRLLLGFAATIVVALAAHISFPLPFTPVPLIMTPLAVLGVGLALGPVAGCFTLLAYLAEGLCGLPVFGPSGPGGAAQLLGPTGGFLMSYPLVAFLAGAITRRLEPSTTRFLAAFSGCAIATFVLFACGAAWFMNFTHHSLYATWIGAVAPFLPGEAVKVLAAAGIYSTLTHPRQA